ncbi:MAG: hypothetical protein KVP17_001167 [Porospora cf. gigantea B]|uniref:uncharacterized protein n=2 Tax=Porospora cf. gigantea B TaxID=2853592 RepID=UPI003571E5B9|nr:MAG: hypothetical protein KVP17_001167 [Porospora cf. gigantea B]
MDQYIWAPLRSLDSFSGGVTAESVQVLLKMEETVNREIVLLGAYRRLLSAPRPLGKAPLTRSAQYKQFVWYLCLAIVQNLEPWKSTETEAQFVPLDAGLWGDTRVALCYLLLCLINSTADPDVRSVWDAWTDLQVTFFDVIKASKNGASLSLFKSATTEILRHYSILMEEIGVATLDGVLVVAELLPASFVSGLQDPRLPDEIPTSLDFLQGEPVTSLCPRKSLPDFYFCQKGVSLPIIEWELTDSEESEELSPAPLPTPPDISVETSDRFCNRVIRQRIRVWHERDAALRPLLRQMHKHWVRDVVTPVEDMRRTDAFEWGSLPFRASAGWRDRLVPCPMGYVTRDPTWKPSHVPVDLPNFPSSQVQRLNSAEIPLGLDGIVRPYGKHRATPFNRKRPPDLKAKSGQLSYMNALFTNVPGAPPGWYGSLANLGRSVDAFYVFDQREISVSSLMRPDPDPHLTHTLTLTRQMWSFSQIAIFVERYVSCPKNFRRISQAVPGKTSRQCVDFYYVMKHLLSLDHLTKAFYQRPHDLQDALVHPLLDKLAELTTSEPDWHDTVVEMVLMFVANTQLSILSEGPGAKPLVRLYEALGKPTQVVPPTRRHQTAKLLVVLTALLPVLSIMRDPDRSRLRNGVWSVPELAELLRHQGTPSAFSLADWRTFESGKHQARASRRKTKSRLNALSLVPNLDTGYFLPDLIGTLQLPSKTCLVNGREVGTGIFCGMRPPLQVFYDFCRKVGGGDPATTSPAPKLPSGFSAVVDSGLLNAKNHTR